MRQVLPVSLCMAVLLVGCGHDDLTTSTQKQMAKQSAPTEQWQTEAANVQEIEQTQLLAWIENQQPAYTLVDVRSPEEFAEGHIASAINIPHEQILADPSLLTKYTHQPVVIYCRSGSRAGKVTDRLQQQQSTDNLYHLTGDILGWNAVKLPLVK